MFYILNPIHKLCVGEKIEIPEKLCDEIVNTSKENAAVLLLILTGKITLSQLIVHSCLPKNAVLSALEYWKARGVIFEIEESIDIQSGYITKNDIYKVVELVLDKPLTNQQVKKIDEALSMSIKTPAALIVEITSLKNPMFSQLLEIIKK